MLHAEPAKEVSDPPVPPAARMVERTPSVAAFRRRSPAMYAVRTPAATAQHGRATPASVCFGGEPEWTRLPERCVPAVAAFSRRGTNHLDIRKDSFQHTIRSRCAVTKS